MRKKIKDMFEKLKAVFGKITEKIKNNEYVIFLNEVWPELKSCAKSPEGIRFLIVWLTVSYVLVGYNSRIMSWYDDIVVPILYQMESNFWIDLITLFLIIVVSVDIYNKFKVRYQFDKYVILTLYFISIILGVYRFCGDYDYFYWIEAISLSYVDVFIIFSVIYLYIAIFNKLYSKLHKSKNTHKDESLLFDGAIDNIEKDIFDFKEDVRDVVEEIKKLDRSKTWSIGINAPWGTGKTSFVNFIVNEISKDYDVIKFFPRNSKSASHIQEDFFNTIASALSKYDSSFSHNIKAYMESLQLIDESGIVKKIVDFYHIWNKKSLKKSIEDSFDSLKKRVLVVIDDFDRLTKEEILEVLKLIDSNAAFPNLIFLTAYDKKQVNKIFEEKYKSDDACFIDKFFNWEYHIPLRSYSYISKYTKEVLCKYLKVSDKEKEKIQNTIKDQKAILKKYIPTLRDAKRYINQFIIDYELVREDVFVNEFLLVELIKYRYYELYKKTYNKEFTELDSSNYNLIKLKENLSNDDNDNKLIILPILEELFKNNHIIIDQTDIEQTYGHIYNTQAFRNYFVDKIFSSLRRKDMKILFSQEWSYVTTKIDEWSNNTEKINDFISYLHSIYSDRNNNNILIYTRILAYVACKMPYSLIYSLFMKNIRIPELEKMNINQKIVDVKSIERIILNKEYDPKLNLAQRIHIDYVCGEYNQDVYLLKDDIIWLAVKKTFISSLNSSEDEGYKLENLYRCAGSMNPDSRKINLDEECADAYRKHIETHPNWYIQNFVGLGMVSSSPDWNTVTCRPFWSQIFRGKKRFKKYLNICKNNKVEKIDRVLNFWRLYEANGYESIEFDNQGNVQEKIDNDLVEECKLLNKLYAIQKEVNYISKNIENTIENNNGKLYSNEKKFFNKILNIKMNKLNDVKLYIKLNGDIRKEIERNLKILA